jgi:hypothetical protein
MLRFIQNEVVPLFSSEYKLVLDYKLVACDTDVEVVRLGPSGALEFALLLGPKVSEDFETWTPAFDFHFPVYYEGCGNDNQVRTPDPALACKMRKKRDRLDCFPKSHFIRQDSVQALVVQRH